MHPNAPGSQVIGWITCRLLCASLHENRVEVHQCEVLDRDEPTQASHPEADAIRGACQICRHQQTYEKGGDLVHHLQHEAMPGKEDPSTDVSLRIVDVLVCIIWQKGRLQDEGEDSERRQDGLQDEDGRWGAGQLVVCFAAAARSFGPPEGGRETAEEGSQGEVPSDEEGHTESASQLDVPPMRELLVCVEVPPRLLPVLRKQWCRLHGHRRSLRPAAKAKQ
mmetsp:Transcript_121443/g.303073  ORF Transcript_121443/g.303073 Transcript_121443/m.303073 type:complete len:222 (+) Transcript_121443:433-1098(+)